MAAIADIEPESRAASEHARFNRVLLLLLVAAVIAVATASFASRAPNRLLGGQPVPWDVVLANGRFLAFLPALGILTGVGNPQSRMRQIFVAICAALFAAAMLWLAGDTATRLVDPAMPAARVSFGAAFWVLEVVALLTAADALQRARLGPAARLGTGALLVLPALLVLFSGAAANLSILQEYANRRDVFLAALIGHVQIVAITLVPTLAIGVPLGVLLFRRPRLQRPVFAVLNVIQTIPSIALFGLLIAPLSSLVVVLPALASLGISGIGVTPAVIALTLYSLLPITRSTAAGLEQVPVAAVDAAVGMGMTSGQVLRRVEAPLAFPVFLAGLRVTLVQAIGMTAVAALIGAGGLGTIIFQGLAASALDLVLLGVVPLVALAVLADLLLKLAVSMMGKGAA